MASSFIIWLISLTIILLVTTMGVRVGGMLARVRDLTFGKALTLALVALVAEMMGIGIGWVVGSLTPAAWQPIPGIAGIVVGFAIALVFFNWMLETTLPKSLVVWGAQIVAVVLGFVAVGAVLTPDVIDAQGQAAQTRTVVEIRDSGTLILSWAAGQTEDLLDLTYSDDDSQPLDVSDYEQISRSELLDLLGPLPEEPYRTQIPEEDGWGHAIEYRLARATTGEIQGVCIRSPGRDGVFESLLYSRGPSATTDADRDIVWADGVLVRWPNRSVPGS